MKRILTLFMLLCASTAFTQNAPITFETGANGNTWTWTTFENGSNPPAQVVANPSATGINTSATVLRMTTQTTGQPWAGVESSHGAGIGSFTLNASNAIVKIMVYKPVISDVGIKFATPSGGSTGELKVSNTLINQWEELTFNFSSKIGEVNDQIIIFMDFQQRTSNNICYVDNITFSAAPTDPTVAAPTPTKAANQVISMFSNAYTNVTVDTWRTSWSNATLTDLQIVGNDTKKYSALDFVGIETVTNQINADTMQNFNIDVWTTNVTTLKIKLVDFGANAAFGGGDDKEHELTFSPTLNQWNTYSIPLANFTNLTTRGHIAQLILVGQPTATGTIFIDNVYFSKSAPVATVPTVAAPTPTKAAIDVKSMFSNAYTNVNVDTWRTSWSSATLTDTTIQGNNTKKYSALDFVGIETTGANLINASNMDTFHVDMWTPNITTFRVKLVDFGADAAFGGGDDKEHELLFTPTQNQWNSLRIPLSNFTGLTTKGHIAQLIFSALPAGTANVFIDNVYFSKASAPVVIAPTTAAPTPTKAAIDVKSMFSNAYTNVNVDTWRTSWSSATLTDTTIQGNDTKKYSALDFVGIETTGANLINASNMDTFHVDMWTPNITTFRVKLVDFGADAAFGGGDDKEHELLFTPIQNQWNSLHIPLSNFTGLTTKSHIAQLIFSALPAGTANVFIDNVYFSKATVVLEPTTAAPNPTSASNNVISMFSNKYTNVAIDTWRTSWSSATLTEMQIQGNDTKKYSSLDFVGVESTGANLINASNMDTFHVDMWTPNITTFRVKLVDFGADAAFGGGDDKEHELLFTPTQNQWNSLHIPLSDFTGLTTKSHIAQLIFSALPTGLGTVYIDNVYFSKKPLVGVNNNENANISIYPNPSTDVLYFTGLNVNETNQVSIFDLQGKLVERYELNENASIDIRNLNKGMYLVKVANHVARIVKM
jgi:hypothetical protein